MKRIIEIPGAISLRDLGETADGRRVRSGVLFRSGMLAELTPDGQSDPLPVRSCVKGCS